MLYLLSSWLKIVGPLTWLLDMFYVVLSTLFVYEIMHLLLAVALGLRSLLAHAVVFPLGKCVATWQISQALSLCFKAVFVPRNPLLVEFHYISTVIKSAFLLP